MYDKAYNASSGTSPPVADVEEPTAATRLAVREALALAADRTGGVDALVKWIRNDKENARIFWSVIYPKLLPLKVDGELEIGKRMAGMVATWLPPQ